MWRVAYVRDDGSPHVLAPGDPLHPDRIDPGYKRERVKVTDIEVPTYMGSFFDFTRLDRHRGHEARRMLEDALARIVKGFAADPGNGTKETLNDLLSWAELWPGGTFFVRGLR